MNVGYVIFLIEDNDLWLQDAENSAAGGCGDSRSIKNKTTGVDATDGGQVTSI